MCVKIHAEGSLVHLLLAGPGMREGATAEQTRIPQHEIPPPLELVEKENDGAKEEKVEQPPDRLHSEIGAVRRKDRRALSSSLATPLSLRLSLSTTRCSTVAMQAIVHDVLRVLDNRSIRARESTRVAVQPIGVKNVFQGSGSSRRPELACPSCLSLAQQPSHRAQASDVGQAV